ncbi:hypothetical protein V8G54_021681 [Vigna mungo]|uniref:RING-CH-type domain-containing protein n=1 Tax=Vigna mungo TaxID=3915 RepID=A0AAQ3NG25_VIGMU
MATLQMSHVDLEQGNHRRSVVGSDASVEGSLCFSDADDGSCYSRFYSTNGGSYDDYSFDCVSDPEAGGVHHSGRASSVSECSVELETRTGVPEIKVHLAKVEKDCRICHMGLVSDSHESGAPIELGCSCKDDLAAAHKHCAEAWFKIKGNRSLVAVVEVKQFHTSFSGSAESLAEDGTVKTCIQWPAWPFAFASLLVYLKHPVLKWLSIINVAFHVYDCKCTLLGALSQVSAGMISWRTCEICHSVARNVYGGNEDSTEHVSDGNNGTTAAATVSTTAPFTEPRRFWHGHRFLNFLLACMVFAFVISWLFHFNVTSS